MQHDPKALARKWHDAPADTVIRTIFDHFANIRDDEDGTRFGDDEECREHWHNLDMLTLVFDDPDRGDDADPRRADYFVRLIHQGPKPSMEDISDYSLSLESHEFLGPRLTDEKFYHPAYR